MESGISRAGGLSFLFDGLLSWGTWGELGEGADMMDRKGERKAENGRVTMKKEGRKKRKEKEKREREIRG